ncbi:MAG: hypothetical protein ACOC4M_08200 [Promethearchaeia archaeon]
MKRTKLIEEELTGIKDFLRTIELKLKTSENCTNTALSVVNAIETYRRDGLNEALDELLIH